MATTTYRFLPWARRGLADRVKDVDGDGSALPARARVTVGLTVSSIPEARYDLALYGPGDVIGVDPRLIVRTDPRPNSTDVEPNYFPLIEFDPPDFPWLFTPATSGTSDRLRPWCVLVVVDLSVVAAPRTEAGKPLPVLVVPSAVASLELPDLAESWAWAHTQAITPAGSVNLAGELASKPAMNVSRIVAPRRLEPGKRYAACLVPAFDAGVTRGLGGSPRADATLGPAWGATSATDIRLPVYFHWEFATGPAGDFESLARRLQPFAAPESVGIERMYIGAAGPELPATPPTDPNGYLEMDGALRAPKRTSGALGDVPPAVQAALATTLDAAAAQAQSGPTPTTPVLGPPVYGEWHARQHTVSDAGGWLCELNLDPRARAAAGLGAEIERQNQEAFMQWCWEQVGRILEANRLLSRSRLSLEALARVHARHFQTLPADRLLQIAGPLHGRTKQGASTILAAIARSSLPNASADPALRRLTSAQRPVLRAAVRRSIPGAGAVTPRVRLIGQLAGGELAVDPTRFVPHGVLGVPELASVAIPTAADATVDLGTVGLPVSAPASLVRQLREDSAALETDRAPAIVPRDDLRTTGILGETHLLRVRELMQGTTRVGQSVTGTLGTVIRRAPDLPGVVGVLVTIRSAEAPTVDGLDVDAAGRVAIRTAAGQPATLLATLDPALLGSAGRDLGAVLVALPRNALDPTVAPPAIGGTPTAPRIMRPLGPARPIGAGGVERPTVERPTGVERPTDLVRTERPVGEVAGVTRDSITLPPPVREVATVTRLEQAIVAAAPGGRIGTPPPALTFVPFAIPTARDALVTRTNPRLTIPGRLGSMLDAGGRKLLADTPPGLTVAPTLDRVMAFPEIDVPVYEYLARLDPARFLPGVGDIPEEAITLLETNARFIEALLVGLNSEMNRELLWRAFPTDQRGTPFRRFWAWTDGGTDVGPIHLWPRTTALGANGRSGPGGQIALLVRGRLLRRYPNTAIYAWRSNDGALINPPGVADIRRPAFAGVLGADIAFVGFDLTDVELTQGDGWFFVLQQQPTEPRFGFDEHAGDGTPPALGSWSDATWTHTGTPPGRYLRIAGSPLAGVRHGDARFVDHAAHLAAITIQKPMRVAVHARSMLQTGTP